MGLIKKLLVITILAFLQGCGEKRVDFSTEVKPILNKHCIACHGGVKKNGGFSVLFRDEALAKTESGKPAIVPGDAAHSEMIRRLTLKDPEERMPYKEKPLTAGEISTLTKWIQQGAEWSDHWAYIPPRSVEVPASSHVLASLAAEDENVKNEIDHFILEKLRAEGLEPSPEADRATLIRRLSLDLTGLPPTPEEAREFMADSDPGAYGKTVDRLLASKHFGEKWASWWLDLARYSDTKGYERDVTRTIWRYRDYVINAFNDDKPFDVFTVEQLAGDLLSEPTDDQLIATAFHRNTMNNDEGGTEDEEFRVASLIDRVSTTWEVFQSTTMACVQCHSHPYDPFRHEDYYRTLAYFNNTRDEDTEGEHPNLRMYEPADQKKLDDIVRWVKEHDPHQTFEVSRFLKTLEPKYHPHDFDQFVNGELIDTKWLGIRGGGSARLKQIQLTGKSSLIIHYWTEADGGSFEIRKDHPRGPVLGTAYLKKTTGQRRAMRIALRPDSGKHDLYFVFKKNPGLKPDQPVCAIEWFAFRGDLPGSDKNGFATIQDSFLDLLNAPVENTPILIENNDQQHRTTYVFERGNWLVKGKQARPQIPASLKKSDTPYRNDRLGFAQWLVSPENPLTARTVVNRVWAQVFGAGLVETLEDFGSQGAVPSHPELLDWLSLRLMNEHRWSLKKLLKDIVMSATYRQSSVVTPESLEKDPSTRLLSRAPRLRLSSEQIRDQALAVSGLISLKMYGKSVMPYQPEGIWQSVWNGEYWKQSEGEDRYRRGVYTFMKRTSPYPSTLIFDGSSREVCLSRRIPTNTPLQALVTLNDPVYVEAARAFAKRMIAQSTSPDDQIRAGYWLITFRDIPEKKFDVLKKLQQEALRYYSADTAAVRKLTLEKSAAPSLASMTVVANALLNLDEVIMRE